MNSLKICFICYLDDTHVYICALLSNYECTVLKYIEKFSTKDNRDTIK